MKALSLALLACLGAGSAFAGSQSGADSTIDVTMVPGIQGGASSFSAIVPNNVVSVAVKATAGQIYSMSAFNNSTTIAYVKLYNATQGNTTCGSGTPVGRYMIPASGGFIRAIEVGVVFSTAISYCVTTGIADADATAPAASTYLVNFTFK